MEDRKIQFCHLFILSFIPAISCDFGQVSLRILPASKQNMQTSIAANLPFNPQIQVEVVDNETRRIKTGFPSQMNISVVLSSSSACISRDANFQLQDGFGKFLGSICSPINNLSISFEATNQNGTVISSDWTPFFTVTDELYLVHFEESASDERSTVNAMIAGAMADINDGTADYENNRPILPGRTLKLLRYFHGGNDDKAVESYRKMKNDFKKTPGIRSCAILGFGHNMISELLLPVSMTDQFAVLSFANDTFDKFSNKEIYPYFNRMVYSDDIRYKALVSYLTSRRWNDIILLKTSDSELRKDFANICMENGIRIHYQVTLPEIKNYNEEPEGKFKKYFCKIKSIGVKIIVTAAKKPTSFYLFTEALRENVTAKFGFQWIGFDSEDDFPHSNQPKGCQNMTNLCNFAFKGMTFLTSFYQINGYSTVQWKKLWKRYFEVEKNDEKVDAAKLWKMGAKFGMAYDAIHVYAMALGTFVSNNKTITGPSLATAVRKIQVTNGMLKHISFTSSGDQSEYFGRLSLVWPNQKSFQHFHGGKIEAGWIQPWDWSLAKIFSNPTNAILVFDPANSSNSIEVKSDGGSSMLHTIDIMGDDRLKNGYIETGVKQRNLRRYRSVRGLFSLDMQRQVEEQWDFVGRSKRKEIDYEEIERKEFVPLPFYCEFGCGGEMKDEENSNSYDNGYCAAQNNCICNTGDNGTILWRGDHCETPECAYGCIHGNCSSPNSCTCDAGWFGSDCNKATCTSPICDEHGGICRSPEQCVCKSDYYGNGCFKKCTCQNGRCNNGEFGDGTCLSCDEGYFGINCTISIYAVVFPSLLCMLLLAVVVKSCSRCYVNRSKLKVELLSDDWMVLWSQLKRSDNKAERSIFLSNDESNEKRMNNTGTWQGFDVHYQKFKRSSIQPSDAFRQEIKILRDLQHENLIKFVGACLQSPNVSVLTELASKGSLDDVLKNVDIALPWLFKYSLLKDICRGLEYIHNSEIESHGRLKSSNCLIDSRWNLKLSGFGLMSFREEDKEALSFKQGDLVPFVEVNDKSEETFYDLLWTSPEILKTGVYHLDQVGYGSREGDVYSFAIVFSEICTRERPFEGLPLTNQEIIDLIAERTTPQINRIWNTYLASRNTEARCPARPCIRQAFWPADKRESRPLKTLIERCWTTDSTLRPFPKDVLKCLERIDPDHGETMEKLVLMLEKYSNNLENIFAERAKALIHEKKATENLISRLLPKPIVEDLKLGKNLNAEHFDCISVLFSDFVDFYSISEMSTPNEVMELLNCIINSFDSIVINYDAHKIQTVGNSYMVASGLPISNGKKHADILAQIALELIAFVRTYKIEHLPDRELQIKVGIHSGSATAGIVGLKVPRYCVFGDTVRIAASIESASHGMKIQISNDTKKLIEHLNYDMEIHGEFSFKDHGSLKTWWLKSKRSDEKDEEEEERVEMRTIID